MKIQKHSDFLLPELSKNEQNLEQTIHYHTLFFFLFFFLTEKGEIEYPDHDTVVTLLVHVKIHDEKKYRNIFVYT